MISGWLQGSPASGEAIASSFEARAEGHRTSRHARDGMIAVCEGYPEFLDADLATNASDGGPAAAWLELYRRIGSRAPERVHGRFACAIVDTRAWTVFLAVDRFGIDTLCHAEDRGRFVFASRADSPAFGGFDIDDQAVFDYLYFHMIPAPRTIRRGVSRLLPGHSLLFANGICTLQRYWNPAFREHETRPFPALRDEFVGLVEQAVARTVNGADTGSFLSGGTDSSTVAGMLGKVSGRPAPTYSIGFDASGYDEMPYARIAAQHFGTDHHEYYVTPDDIVDNVPRVVDELDQPFGNSSVLPAYCCARFARDDGMSRLLAGDGGDELFGGNSRYAKQRVFELYHALPQGMRSGVIERAIDGAPALFSLPLARKCASYVAQARVPMPDRMQMYNLLQRIGADNLLEPAFASAVDVEDPLRQQRDVYGQAQGDALINRMLAYDWKFTLADSDLPKVVSATRAAGVEVAFPLLDQRLVEFSLALQPELKLRGLKLRYFFKEALRGFLPDEIIRKRKHGFGLPFGRWAVSHPRLRDFVLASLTSFKSRGYVKPAFIDELVDTHLPAYPNYYGELVWILMMLEQWLEKPRPARTA